MVAKTVGFVETFGFVSQDDDLDRYLVLGVKTISRA